MHAIYEDQMHIYLRGEVISGSSSSVIIAQEATTGSGRVGIACSSECKTSLLCFLFLFSFYRAGEEGGNRHEGEVWVEVWRWKNEADVTSFLNAKAWMTWMPHGKTPSTSISRNMSND